MEVSGERKKSADEPHFFDHRACELALV